MRSASQLRSPGIDGVAIGGAHLVSHAARHLLRAQLAVSSAIAVQVMFRVQSDRADRLARSKAGLPTPLERKVRISALALEGQRQCIGEGDRRRGLGALDAGAASAPGVP